MEKFKVRLLQHEYPVYIGNNLLNDVSLLKTFITSQKVLVVTNDIVAPLYLKLIQDAYCDLQCDVVILPDGEAYKTPQSLNKIYDVLVNQHHHRDTTLIALGGGVIGDITGFAASTYHRGARFIQVPTTLLAQIDASIGGKTGINHPKAKNMIGSFYQPEAVVIDLNMLQTLPEREFCAGLAEMIKYALLAGGDIFDHLNQLLLSVADKGWHRFSVDTWKELEKLITLCCQYKASIVEQDEREHGDRALLNLGHTFAHALEAYTNYERWLHGEAVVIGLHCAALLSYQLGYITQSRLNQIDLLLSQANLPNRIPTDIDLNILHQFLFHDKKIKQQRLRFILMKGPGHCFIDDQVPDLAVKNVLHDAQQ